MQCSWQYSVFPRRRSSVCPGSVLWQWRYHLRNTMPSPPRSRVCRLQPMFLQPPNPPNYQTSRWPLDPASTPTPQAPVETPAARWPAWPARVARPRGRSVWPRLAVWHTPVLRGSQVLQMGGVGGRGQSHGSLGRSNNYSQNKLYWGCIAIYGILVSPIVFYEHFLFFWIEYLFCLKCDQMFVFFKLTKMLNKKDSNKSCFKKTTDGDYFLCLSPLQEAVATPEWSILNNFQTTRSASVFLSFNGELLSCDCSLVALWLNGDY